MQPRRDDPAAREGERGSAIVLSLLIAVIMTLLGLSFVWMAETEVRIAENQSRATQARYLAEGSVRVVKRWFDAPGTALAFPPVNVVDRSLRLIDVDGDGPTPSQAAGGGIPEYKEGIDRDGDGDDDIFQVPFRFDMADLLLGTPDGPDMRIDAATGGATEAFLEDLVGLIAPALGDEGGLLRPRISRIDVYGPPYVQDGGSWVRFGLGRVRVTAELLRGPAGCEPDCIVAQSTVEAVLNETPYYGPFGPLHSCAEIDWSNDFSLYWGAVTGMRDSDMPSSVSDYPLSLPRRVPGDPRRDPVWGTTWAFDFDTYLTARDLDPVEDPWFRIHLGGLMGIPDTATQPDPSDWRDAGGGSFCCDHSNLGQRMAFVGCPTYDYDLWKALASSGERGVRYYSWDGSGFLQNGRGTSSQSFQDITHNQSGIFFFDTIDGLAPEDTDGDLDFDNLTPPITLSGSWNFSGMIYLNAESIQLTGVTGVATTFNAPGEPFFDEDGDDELDAGEDWVNLAYHPTDIRGSAQMNEADALQDPGGTGSSAMRNSIGPPIVDDASMVGILYTNGLFQSRGSGVIYGSVIAREGVSQSAGGSDRVEIFFDGRMADNLWPPPALGAPRVVITRWTELR